MTRSEKMWELVLAVCARHGLVPPFEPEDYRDAQQAEMNCLIVMEPHLMEQGVTGLCTPAGDDMYVVFFEPRGSIDQRRKIKYHELRHIELGHVSLADGRSACRGYLPTGEQELDVECFADVIATYSSLGTFVSDLRPMPAGKNPSRFGRFLNELWG